jgi:histidinol-phosphate aminotransferase
MDKGHVNFLNERISTIEPYKIAKGAQQIMEEFNLTAILQLASNENPSGPSQNVVNVLGSFSSYLSTYITGNELKAKLAKNLKLSESNITLGNGSTELLYMIGLGFIDSTSNVITSQYAYSFYKRIVLAMGAAMVTAPAKNWACDLDAIKNAINNQTKLIIIDNPNNPTGTLIPFNELKNFIDTVPENILIVIDEAYHEYVDSTDYSSTVDLVENHPNLIVLRSFSKGYGLAGLRVGYSISSPHVADILNRIMSPYSVNALGLMAAQTVLDDQQYLAESVLLNKQGLQQLQNGFDNLAINYIDSCANFTMVELGSYHPDANQLLLQSGIIIRPLDEYNLKNYYRITVGLPWMNDYLLTALKSMHG